MEVCDPCHSQFTCSLEQMTGMKILYLVAHTNQLIVFCMCHNHFQINGAVLANQRTVIDSF